MIQIRIETGARLHLGLLDTQVPFGGLGVMIDCPLTTVRFSPAESFRCDPAIKQRAYPIAERLCRFLGRKSLPNVLIELVQAAPAHCGLGSGTQISLAIAEGLSRSFEETLPAETLACVIADRGKRSAVGIHGYFDGGLIFESSSGQESSADQRQILNTVDRRVEPPTDWRIVVFTPTENVPSVFGEDEKQQFGELVRDARSTRSTRSLRRQIEEHILPAAEAGQFAEFASAVESYNHASGMLFASVQGGPYNGPVVSDLIDRIRSHGGAGVGQSSWGPGVFAWCDCHESATALADQFRSQPVQTRIAKVKTQGRNVLMEPSD